MIRHLKVRGAALPIQVLLQAPQSANPDPAYHDIYNGPIIPRLSSASAGPLLVDPDSPSCVAPVNSAPSIALSILQGVLVTRSRSPTNRGGLSKELDTSTAIGHFPRMQEKSVKRGGLLGPYLLFTRLPHTDRVCSFHFLGGCWLCDGLPKTYYWVLEPWQILRTYSFLHISAQSVPN